MNQYGDFSYKLRSDSLQIKNITGFTKKKEITEYLNKIMITAKVIEEQLDYDIYNKKPTIVRSKILFHFQP